MQITNMPTINQVIEEGKKGDSIESVLSLWKKYFSDKMGVCPDCSGWSTLVCEKVMRDFLGALIGNFDRTTAHQNELLLKAVEEMCEGMKKKTNDVTFKGVTMTFTTTEKESEAFGFNSALDDLKTALNSLIEKI